MSQSQSRQQRREQERRQKKAESQIMDFLKRNRRSGGVHFRLIFHHMQAIASPDTIQMALLALAERKATVSWSDGVISLYEGVDGSAGRSAPEVEEEPEKPFA